MTRIFFVAGDLSGDLHAARVAACLKAKSPRIEIMALGGPSLKRVADRFLANLVDESVVGFWEPLKKLPRFWRLLNGVIKPALKELPSEVVVPVDFFGFNRFTAKAARKAGSRVLYFISPQVWASRPWRADVLKRFVDQVLLIFPFEKAFYEKRRIPSVFVGHPLLDVVPNVPEEEHPLRVEPVVGLLPGSREGEVRRHLPLFLRAADMISEQKPGARFMLFAAPSLSNDFYDGLLGRNVRRPYLLEIVRDEDYKWRSEIDIALTCSGTATLENALLGLPMIVVYKMSWLTYTLARTLANVPHIAMPNLLTGKRLVPELIQEEARPENIAKICLEWFSDPKGLQEVRRELLQLRHELGGPGAAERAADEILRQIQER
ncbi:MAG: lipid-A-disaccharide synthase [Elusimicrobia bacterium]|nr:lipid-A-disaccharide synthase [Elusimicrobiota bacterium]